MACKRSVSKLPIRLVTSVLPPRFPLSLIPRRRLPRLPRWLPFEWIVALRFLREGRTQTLFIIGGNLVGLQVRGLRRQVGLIALGKLVLHPAAVWGAIALLAALGLPVPEGDLRAAAVLSAAMPMLGVYAILAQRHGHEGFAAAALLGTTAASFVSLNAILWLMRHSAGWLG